jgi:hypothetical protein
MAMVVVLALVAGLGAATLGALLQQRRRAIEDEATLTTGIRPSWSEFAEKIDLSQVRAKSGLAPRRPNHVLARDELITAVWFARTGAPLISFHYASGVEVKIQAADVTATAAYPDLHEYFVRRAEGFASEPGLGLKESEVLTTINGAWALVVPQKLPGQDNEGFVEFVTPDDVHVVVRGYLDNKILIEIAETIR